MARWYFDTSVLVAAAIADHVHHSRAMSVLEELVRGRNRGYISAHGLTEVYSVLTRTPFRTRVHPSEAFQTIEDQLLHMTLVPLDAAEYVEVVSQAAQRGLIGGRIHDAVHLQCAVKMKCDRVYTFNVRDFRALAPKSLADKISAP